MKTRPFGLTGIRVSELCLGTSTFARFASQQQAFAMLDAFHAAGGNFIQTSGICPGANLGDGFLGLPEEFLGRWLDARGVCRRDIVLATRMGFARPLFRDAPAYDDLMRACVRDSLRRIRTGHVDFLVVEWSDALLPLDESMAALARVVREGCARHVILAHLPTGKLGAAQQRGGGALAGLQLDYSLIYRSLFEREASAFCREHALGFMARSPLAGGHLVSWPAPDPGSFQCRSAGDPSIATRAHAVWPALCQVARHHGVSPAQVAVAWTLGQPGVTSTLISVRSLPQLHELLAGASLELSTTERASLETTVSAVDRPAAPALP